PARPPSRVGKSGRRRRWRKPAAARLSGGDRAVSAWRQERGASTRRAGSRDRACASFDGSPDLIHPYTPQAMTIPKESSSATGATIANSLLVLASCLSVDAPILLPSPEVLSPLPLYAIVPSCCRQLLKVFQSSHPCARRPALLCRPGPEQGAPYPRPALFQRRRPHHGWRRVLLGRVRGGVGGGGAWGGGGGGPAWAAAAG